MKIFVGLRTKTYSYLSDGGGENKKAKHAKKYHKKSLNLKTVKTVQKLIN